MVDHTYVNCHINLTLEIETVLEQNDAYDMYKSEKKIYVIYASSYLHPVYQQKPTLLPLKRLISSYIYPLSVIAQYYPMLVYLMTMKWIFVDTVMDCILHSEYYTAI